MDQAILWRVALAQAFSVVLLSLLLALIFSEGFFESWGWLAGPLAWLLCAWFTARVVGLPEGAVVLRAALAGIPSLLFVLLGAHWLGAVLALAIFAALCARLPRPVVSDFR